MDDILSLAHPRVKAFVEATGAKIISLEDFDVLVGGMTKNDKSKAFANAAFYNPKYDVIVVNLHYRNDLLDRTILHELGHWSGHSSRLIRKVTLVEEKKSGSYEPHEFDTEEITAEMVAYQLGTDMGIMTQEWEKRSARYIASYNKGNESEARINVLQAVWFLVKLAMPTLKVV